MAKKIWSERGPNVVSVEAVCYTCFWYLNNKLCFFGHQIPEERITRVIHSKFFLSLSLYFRYWRYSSTAEWDSANFEQWDDWKEGFVWYKFLFEPRLDSEVDSNSGESLSHSLTHSQVEVIREPLNQIQLNLINETIEKRG